MVCSSPLTYPLPGGSTTTPTLVTRGCPRRSLERLRKNQKTITKNSVDFRLPPGYLSPTMGSHLSVAASLRFDPTVALVPDPLHVSTLRHGKTLRHAVMLTDYCGSVPSGNYAEDRVAVPCFVISWISISRCTLASIIDHSICPTEPFFPLKTPMTP